MVEPTNIRIIKRYGNRKLYDTELSRYVTIEEVASYIKNGFSVRILDNQTKEDITSSTLVQIVLDAEKKNRHQTNTSVLESVIKTGNLSEFINNSTSTVKTGIEEFENWFNKIVDTNKSFWFDMKNYFRKNKKVNFEEFGSKMEEYFESTVSKIKHTTSIDKKRNEREVIFLKQKILELENLVKIKEEEARRLKDE